MKNTLLVVIMLLLVGFASAQTSEEKLKALQNQLDEIQIDNGNEDDVDARKINENIAQLENILKKRDSLNFQISLLKTELLLAQAKLKSCKGDGRSGSNDCNEITDKNSIYFDLNSIKVLPNESRKLDALYAELNPKILNGKKVLVVGYTDPTGSARYNLTLSQKRANAVKTYLNKKGIKNTQIVLDSRGETDQLVENNGKSELNRRVVVLLF